MSALPRLSSKEDYEQVGTGEKVLGLGFLRLGFRVKVRVYSSIQQRGLRTGTGEKGGEQVGEGGGGCMCSQIYILTSGCALSVKIAPTRRGEGGGGEREDWGGGEHAQPQMPSSNKMMCSMK